MTGDIKIYTATLFGLANCLAAATAAEPPLVLELPTYVVTPIYDPLFEAERRIRALGKHLPDLGGDALPPSTGHALTDALGLTGDGIQAAHPATQQRAMEFLDRLEGLN